MKIKFTHDFQGKLTKERFYLEGEEAEIDTDVAHELIALNHAVAVEVEVKRKSAPRKVSKPVASEKKESANAPAKSTGS